MIDYVLQLDSVLHYNYSVEYLLKQKANGNCCSSLTIAVISTLPSVQLTCPIFNYPEAISSINVKLEMAKNIHLQIRKHAIRDKHCFVGYPTVK